MYNFCKGKEREKQYKRLKSFLVNPGRFCLIVLGERGTGKKFSIENAFEEIKGQNYPVTNSLVFVDHSDFPFEKEKIDPFLREHEDGIIVIESIDLFSTEQQQLLFETLSTTNGRFGIKEEFNIRFIFTSSVNPEVLREEDSGKIHGNLWDRISQLVVQFPSFEREPDSIVSDFEAVWKKMKFEKLNFPMLSKFPKNYRIEKFLEDNARRFEGGFRDLDKIAAMYLNYRILYYKEDMRPIEEKEKEIIGDIESDFFGLSQHKGSTSESVRSFTIEDNVKWVDMRRKFRKQVKVWAKKHYGGTGKAARALDVDPSTMQKW